jgi:hypothetical protein
MRDAYAGGEFEIDVFEQKNRIVEIKNFGGWLKYANSDKKGPRDWVGDGPGGDCTLLALIKAPAVECILSGGTAR